MGSDTGVMIGLGQRVTVKLVEAAPVTGGIGLELLTLQDAELPGGSGKGRMGRGSRPKGKGGPKRNLAKAKKKDAKTKRKVTRQRRNG
jgi:ribonuclease R